LNLKNVLLKQQLFLSLSSL